MVDDRGLESDKEEEHHISIASLRSKFETLAHGHIHSRNAPVIAPKPARLPAPQQPAAASPAVSAAPPVAVTAKPDVAQVPKPDVAGPPVTRTPPPVAPKVPPPPKPAPRTVASTTASTNPPAPRPVVNSPPAPERVLTAPSVNLDTATADADGDGDEHVQSVKALRERFGQVTSAPAPIAPSGSRRASLEALRKGDSIASPPAVSQTSPVISQVSPAGSQASSSAKPLIAPKPALIAPKPAYATVRPSSPALRGPAPPPPISRSASPFGQTLSASPAPDSQPPSRSASPLGHRPAPQPPATKPTPPALPLSRPPVADPIMSEPGSLVSEPVPIDSGAAPPPIPGNRPTAESIQAVPIPIPRGSSPAPPPSRRPVVARVLSASPPSLETALTPPPLPPPERRPTLQMSPSPPAAGAVPPPLPPPNRRPTNASTISTSSAASVETVAPSLPVTRRPTEAQTVPSLPQRHATPPEAGHVPPPLPTTKRPDAGTTIVPPLPVRRPSFHDGATPAPDSKPPLPGNKPPAPTMMAAAAAVIAVTKPPLPNRSRATTVGKPEVPPAAAATAPPRLPVRQATALAAPAVPIANRSRALSVGAHDDGYLPPPPPMRNVTAGPGTSPSKRPAVSPAPLRRAATVRVQGSGGTPGDSDDDEGGPVAPLTSIAQRLLDEHPDSTKANRRPPTFLPDIKVTLPLSITSFAVYGRFACVAHHNVRVFDTESDCNQPILTFDQKDVGLDLRVKEPRVTAMGFRPSKFEDQKGRYLWCGNKDGHVWEIDIKTGDVTATKPSVHGAAVTHIMRHQQWVLTLDEVGKLHVWEPAKEDSTSFRIVRTLRISDKVTFAKMIKGRLWTATAPAVRSTTSTNGARGPTVRVYDPCSENGAAPLSALTTEWTGSVTSATVMPFAPDYFYLGHEGGFISIWKVPDNELVCQQVLKISTTDILSLEGVGERLWAGNRRGQIHVWDVKNRPWLTTNFWTAHIDQPVHTLVVDPASIDGSGRFMLWSCSRDALHAWDGLLGVDWIESQMALRREQYCDMRDIKVLVCTWNIDSTKPTDLTGSIENATFLEQVLSSVDSPDIVVFGFQEVIPLTDKKLTAKTLLFGSKGKDGGGATNEAVSGRYRAWAEKLSYAVRLHMPAETPYVKVHSEQLVGLFSCIFVKASEREQLRDVDITTVKRGIGGIYGNKGAIVARLVVDDTSLCFINVHLAAGQSHKNARNADVAAILEDKAIFPPADRLPYVHGGDGTAILDHELIILNGDLNYRIDQRRDLVASSIKVGDLDFLLEHDQLRKEMRANHAFRLRSFAEPPITFAPTYKYDPGTNDYDSSEKRRIPAWCDRVLYLKSPLVTPMNYQRYEITCSDHKPVSSALGMRIKRIDPIRRRDVAREVANDWSKREEEMLVAVRQAYAGLYSVGQ